MPHAITIHAGLPKTGTTYLQQRFVDNRAWLSANGVHYPTIGQEIGPGHHNLAQLFRGESIDEPWAQGTPDASLAAALGGTTDRVLLSSETFSSLHMDRAAQLKRALGSSDVTWVLYLRRRSDLAFSRWQEGVKHGSARTFAEYLTAQLLGAGDVLRIEDSVAVALRTFGVESLRIVVFEELAARGVDLFEHFIEKVLGLPTEGLGPASAASKNTSLPTPTVETLRALNAASSHGEVWANGGLEFALAANAFLQGNPEGQSLLRDVTAAFEAHAELLDLSNLDQQWLNRDHEIVRACGAQILNDAGGARLFPDSPARSVRVLRPSVLHEHVPVARFAAAFKSIANQMNG